MTTYNIVCSYDAARDPSSPARLLGRVLGAEGVNVELCYGRETRELIERTAAARDPVILLWTSEAVSASYMRDWQKSIDPQLLIELACVPFHSVPEMPNRRAALVEFGTWHGQRAGHEWRGLQERMKWVERALNPPRPVTPGSLAALAAATGMALTGAWVIRAGDDGAQMQMAAQDDAPGLLAADDPSTGLGGPLVSEEPAGIDDGEVNFGPLARRAEAIQAVQYGPMASPAPIADPLDAREAQLLDRLAEFAQPLLDEFNR